MTAFRDIPSASPAQPTSCIVFFFVFFFQISLLPTIFINSSTCSEWCVFLGLHYLYHALPFLTLPTLDTWYIPCLLACSFFFLPHNTFLSLRPIPRMLGTSSTHVLYKHRGVAS
ncbi:uncharacterized protein F4812DRAFT_423689 [Daldinia caldariorum]|uniref:uncharacterized protein n=1 Tax=Daldinia caldariorum TaxID=326644 RepID=UPI002007771B|nr:uncharacterized protein F4812DRAFT_423689 [Daldinia caldariorum]KAI1469568.1 hypothetical protein F4812DRAFT_423689 [Daldinia caldariorum]